MLVQLKVAHKGLTEYMRQEDTDDAPPSDTDAQALAQVSERCQLLEQGRNSLSRRVKVVLDTIRQHLDVRLDDSFTIADESVWFLDIVAIALMKVIIRSITIHTVANTTIPIPPHHQKGNPSCAVACPACQSGAQDCAFEKYKMEVQGKKNKINACILSAITRDRSLINVALYCLDWSKWRTRSEGLCEP
ncbi:hypothetical protein FOTG_09357 [Fusarium oxysporum f. sp. vasinfectum 25433]|uniref:Uncharacterized protein n=1 Tax=Fusarium oxysporum f. sp. vasinfectum 25433 TaxID=1089449 RepID=X0LAP6_FUSOX|nr:hypothetical protein FOTG_09357 [Fusarium oxysporum f. sp. vasinfectum 25433]